LWLRAVPALGIALGLFAWAGVEPYNAERLSPPALSIAVAALILWGRAALRAARALAIRDDRIVAGTVGLLRPRIVVSERLRRSIDATALRAAHEHEAAHVRHRDPLRIWLAQFVTDLLWPWERSQVRFRAWRHALELARDEEALARAGVRGPDLAAAIVAAARLQLPLESAIALLASDAALLQARVRHLLRHARPARRVTATTTTAVEGVIVLALAIWFALGATAGETLVEPFLLR
jgi:beta-lactamase regulating signal transducer with metallopeptidase domain